MRKPRLDSEIRLVRRLQAGEADAVTDLAATHGTRIFQVAFRCLRNHEDAQELTQDVLFIVWRRIRAFRYDAALSSWIHRITFNAAMSRLRRTRRGRRIEHCGLIPWSADFAGDTPVGPEPADHSLAADELLLQRETCADVRDAIQFIPLAFRRCLVLRDLEGLSTLEASQLLRVKPQTVKSRIHRGRRMLRERLAVLDAARRGPYTDALSPRGGAAC